MVGAAAETTKFTATEVPLLELELATVMGKVPALAKSVAGIWACSSPALMTVVGRALPFHCTMDDEVKPAPIMVMVNAGPPCTPFEGVIPQINGTFEAETAYVTLGEKTNPPTPFGVYTLTLSHPAVAMSAALIVVVSCVELTNVLQVTLGLPFHSICEPSCCDGGSG